MAIGYYYRDPIILDLKMAISFSYTDYETFRRYENRCNFTSHKSHEETPVLIIATGKGAKKAPKTCGNELGASKGLR